MTAQIQFKRITTLHHSQKLLVWTRFSVPEFTEDCHLFPLEHVTLNLTFTTKLKTTKCVNSSTLTKINLLVMQWRVKYGEPINESQAQVKVRDWFSYLVEIIVGHCLL